MTTYLTIMVTVLVTTQVIRLTQNAIQLKRMDKRMEQNDHVEEVWEELIISLDRLSLALERKEDIRG